MSDMIEAITRLYQAEDHARKVTTIAEVPTSYDALTTAWLTDAICARTPGAKVEAFTLDARDDGSANRRRIFLTYNTAGRTAGLPPSVFCKATENLLNRIVLGSSGAGETEVNFYNRVRPALPLEAPRALYAGYDPANHASFVMLEDLGGQVSFCDDRTEMDWSRAVSQVETLAALHAHYYQSPALGSLALPFPTWTDWWENMVTVSPGYMTSCDQGFAASEALMSPALFKRRAEVLPATARSVARHASLPHTLTHCDVHLKNWYITQDNRMGLSDWQNVTVGHWSRDYVYATVTALTIENRRKWEQDLLTVYLTRMHQLGVPKIDRDEAWLNLRQQMLAALAFWTLTLCPPPGMPEMQPERVTRAFLRRHYAAIEDYASLDSFN